MGQTGNLMMQSGATIRTNAQGGAVSFKNTLEEIEADIM